MDAATTAHHLEDTPNSFHPTGEFSVFMIERGTELSREWCRVHQVKALVVQPRPPLVAVRGRVRSKRSLQYYIQTMIARGGTHVCCARWLETAATRSMPCHISQRRGIGEDTVSPGFSMQTL